MKKTFSFFFLIIVLILSFTIPLSHSASLQNITNDSAVQNALSFSHSVSCKSNKFFVSDESLGPLSGALINLTGQSGEQLAFGYTDRLGRFEYKGCGKTIIAYASAKGYNDTSIQVALLDCSQCNTFAIIAPENASIGETVIINVKNENKSCVNCDVNVTDPNGNRFFMKTDENGVFKLAINTAGKYNVSAGDAASALIEVARPVIITPPQKPSANKNDLLAMILIVVIVFILLFIYLSKQRSMK